MSLEGFNLWGPKTQSAPYIFECLTPSGDSPWPKEHFGYGQILGHLKTPGEIKQKLI